MQRGAPRLVAEGSDRVGQIIQHEQLADELQSKSDEHRWEAARLISEELADGKTQRELGREIGKSQTHVSFAAKTWDAFGADYQGNHAPSWNEAYHSPEVRAPQREEPPAPEPDPNPAGGEPDKPGGNGPPTGLIADLVRARRSLMSLSEGREKLPASWHVHVARQLRSVGQQAFDLADTLAPATAAAPEPGDESNVVKLFGTAKRPGRRLPVKRKQDH